MKESQGGGLKNWKEELNDRRKEIELERTVEKPRFNEMYENLVQKLVNRRASM